MFVILDQGYSGGAAAAGWGKHAETVRSVAIRH